MSAPTWNEEFELRGGSCPVSDIQDYFEYIIKKYETFTDNPSIKIYVNKIEKRITFRTKTGYYLKVLTPEAMKLLESSKNKITKVKMVKIFLIYIEITEVVLVYCNIVNNDYQQDSRSLYTFVPNKFFWQLLDISPKNFIFLKTFSSEFLYIEAWFTDQSSKHLGIEDKHYPSY